MKRKPKFVLPTKYILLILSGVCIVAILLSFTLGISGGPLNTVAGYVSQCSAALILLAAGLVKKQTI